MKTSVTIDEIIDVFADVMESYNMVACSREESIFPSISNKHVRLEFDTDYETIYLFLTINGYRVDFEHLVRYLYPDGLRIKYEIFNCENMYLMQLNNIKLRLLGAVPFILDGSDLSFFPEYKRKFELHKKMRKFIMYNNINIPFLFSDEKFEWIDIVRNYMYEQEMNLPDDLKESL
jgi:hypothetical protein